MHNALQDQRSKKERKEEWFRVPAKDAVTVVSRLLQELGGEDADA